MDVAISIKELKQYNVKLLLNSERKMIYRKLEKLAKDMAECISTFVSRYISETNS